MADSSEDKTAFTPAPSGGGDARPASSRAGSSGLGWSPPTIESLQAMLPQYEIVSMLGHGGMGAVYKGKQISLDRMVAIKILPPGLEDDDAKFTERFRNEARTMARMNHPGIVSVYDFGETAEGQFYFVMEYVDGTDVAKMIQSSVKLPPDHALAITAHVCDALGYAHGNGVIHRDIKPANILINMQGQVKVADFGLAKHEDPSMTSGLTKTGMAMGTPDFVAPEALIMGVNVDGRADLYAIGVMLYQMLTGDIPRGLFLMPSVKSNGEIDPRFDKIITRAMQTDREERYQKASEIRKDLDVILTAPRVKQDASKAVAAVPQGAVKNVPGQRSAAQKPMPRGPGQPGAKKEPPAPAPNLKSQIAGSKSKSKTGLFIGIAAAVAVIGGGAVFMFSGGKPANDASSANTSDASANLTSRTPIKVTETPKPKPPVAEAARIPTSQAGGGGASVGSLATSATSDGWTDGLAEWAAVPGNVDHGTIKQEAGGWRVATGESVNLASSQSGKRGKALANLAVRVTAPTPASYLNIILRDQGTALSYSASLSKDGKSHIAKSDHPIEGAQFARSADFDPAGRHVMEFRAVGDVLTLIIDGRTAGSVQDSSLSNGSFSVHGSVGSVIEKIEYRDLGSAAAVAESARIPTSQAGSGGASVGSLATSATSEGWIDGLAEWLAVPGNAKSGNLVAEAGAWRNAGSAAIALGTQLPGRALANLAVRVTVREMSSNGIAIHLRNDAKTRRQYGISIGMKSGMTQVTLNANGKAEPLASFKGPAGYAPDATHVLEFRAEGDLLTVLVDGKQTGSIKDATIAAGRMEVIPMHALIEKIEYRDLGAVVSASPLSSLTKDTPFINSLGMKFVPVPITGGPTDGKNVLFSIWEARRSDYQQFVSATKRDWQKNDWQMAGFVETPDHPATVSWEDATEFCGWLTKQERESGKIAKDAVYRLPKDHEWSCAVGIGAKEDPAASPTAKSGRIEGYFWGTLWPPPQGVENYYGEEAQSVPYGKVAPLAGYRDPFPRTAPVGSFKPNERGIYDLGGNVGEWCEDKWGTNSAGAEFRVVRGGAWWKKYDNKEYFLNSSRTDHPRTARYGFDGFRVVLELPASGDAASDSAAIPPAPVPAAPADPKQTINLLALIDPKRDGLRGDWELVNGELHGNKANKDPFTRLALPFSPPAEYDFRIRFTRLSGISAVAQHLACGKHDVMWIMGGFGDKVWGLEKVGGVNGDANETTIQSGLTNGQRYESLVKVRRDRVQVVVDGKLVVDYKTDGSDLSVNEKWTFSDPTKLGVGCQAPTIFHSIEFIPVGSAADSASTTVLPSAPVSSTPVDPKLAALLPNYTKAITNGLTTAAPADKPSFEAELARLKNNAPLPDAAEDAKLPPELKRLRGILRAQLK